MNFWARSGRPGEPSFEYRGGAAWEVERPADGEPAMRQRVRCAVCARELTFTVHSVAAAVRRRRLWRWSSWNGYAVLGLGMAVAVAGFTGESAGLAVGGAVVAFVGVMGGVLAWAGSLAEVGVTGHGNGVPGLLPAHAVVLDRRGPE
jgi:hypothetical protein